MQWLIALTGFAGVMAILSAIVTVLVEGVHKVAGFRRAGLEEMLRALHDDVLVNLHADAPADAKAQRRASANFSRDVTINPAFGGHGRWWWLRNLPLLKQVFQRRFDRLTTLQYVEQLAQTDFGRAVEKYDRGALRRVLATASYQFERFGQAQSDYFKRRAKVIAALVALTFVLIMNVDGLRLYKYFAQHQEAVASVQKLVDSPPTQALLKRADQASVSLAQLDQELAQPEGATPEQRARAKEAVQALRQSITDAQGTVRGLEDLDLPIGDTQFPYCTNTKAKAPDPCAPVVVGLPFKLEVRDAPARVIANSYGWMWLVSVIATSGLLGLGAPFWFDLFRNLTQIAAPARAAQPAEPQGENKEQRLTSSRGQLRDGGAVDPDSLTEAFLIARGRVVASAGVAPPPGRRVGPSSATGASGGAPAGAAMRHVYD